MHPLIQAAARVLSVDAAGLQRQVEAAPLTPARTPTQIESFVREYYAAQSLPPNFSFYDRHGRAPAVIWRAPTQIVTSESASIVPAQPFLRPPINAIAPCLKRLTASAAHLWSDEILRLHSIHFDQAEAQATFSLGRFFDYRFTTGLLNEEAAAGAHALRDVIMPAMSHFDQRFTGGGLQALVAIARPAPYNDFAIPLQVRSGRVSDGQGLHGVIPMAYHQPIRHGDQVDVRGISTALREFAEELCGLDEKQTAEFETMPAVVELRRHAIIEILGFSLNLVNGNYDYNILICHPDPAYWDLHARHWSPNWEAERTFILSSRDHGTFHRLVAQEAWVPQSLISLCEGFDRLRAIDPRRVG